MRNGLTASRDRAIMRAWYHVSFSFLSPRKGAHAGVAQLVEQGGASPLTVVGSSPAPGNTVHQWRVAGTVTGWAANPRQRRCAEMVRLHHSPPPGQPGLSNCAPVKAGRNRS